MTDQVILTLRDGPESRPVEATRVVFSVHQCFAADDDSAAACLMAVGEHLAAQPGLALYGGGPILDALLRHCPDLLPHVRALIVDRAAPRPADAASPLPVINVGAIPAEVSTVFLCETRYVPRRQMRRRLPPHLRVIDLDVLADIATEAIPARAWTPTPRHIYPIEVPEISFKDGLDLLLIDCPARNLALLPNGLGYVHNALKKSAVNFQTFDLDIVTYHRYHMRRIFDEGGAVVLPGGRTMPVDPWQAEHYDLWADWEVIECVMPIIEEAAAEIVRTRPKILGLSIQQCSEVFSRALVKRVKAARPETVILVGGFSCYNADIGLRVFPEADYMCVGEADLTVGPLVEALARGERPRDLPGVLSRLDTPGRMFAPAPMPHNLDQLDFPRYEWFGVDIYRNYNGYQLVPIIASRGCRWSRCTFCAERFYWRIRSPKNFVRELRWLVEQGCFVFMFNESDLNGMPDKLLAICDEIIRSGLKVRLTGQLRVNKKSDRAFFDKLHEAGFVALRFGIDAFSENTLRLQKKGYTTEMVSQNLKDCWEAGIYTEVNWVVGVPGETEQDCDEGVDLMLRNRAYIGRLANINPLMLVNGGVYWIDPEGHNIRFHRPKAELYEEFPRALPASEWYSVEPHIDAHVRRARFERIILKLHEAGFAVGAWATRIIEDVHKARDKLRSAPVVDALAPREGASMPTPVPDAVIPVAPADAGAVSAAAPPRLVRTLGPYNIVAYDGKFYGLPEALGPVELRTADVAKLRGLLIRDTEEALEEAIRSANRWADSRGHYDEQQRQLERGSLYRAGSALGESGRAGPLQARPLLVPFDHGVYAIAPKELAKLGSTVERTRAPGAGVLDTGAKRWTIARAVTKGALPDHLTTYHRHNVVEFDGCVYVLPFGCAVRLEDEDAIAVPGAFSTTSPHQAMRRLCDKLAAAGLTTPADEAVDGRGSQGPAADFSPVPRLVGSLEGHNLVAYEGWIYGIPQGLGPVDLAEIDALDLPGVLRDVSRDAVENEIRERAATAQIGA